MAPGGMPVVELPLLEDPPTESGNEAELAQINALRRHADSVLPGGARAQKALEALIDWCIGYAFHECGKLKEDAFQGQHYANRLIQISRSPAVTADMYNPLRGLGGQTSESSSRELSRIMLALKVVLARHDQVPTLVFDEIDAGIGGEVGAEVGAALAEVAARRQVLVITHLPQIAARAERHLVVSKVARRGLATSDVQQIHGEDRVTEIARMLGDADAATARQHAAALLGDAVRR